MITISQLIRHKRKIKLKIQRKKELGLNPQLKGHCIRIYKAAPKKPNSARRSVARVAVSNGNKIAAYIPGEGHNLQRFSCVLIKGGKIPDLPGVHYKIVRGKYDCHSVIARRNGRSLYGSKKWNRKIRSLKKK